MTASEQAYCKITLFLLRDWDSFQLVMRDCLRQEKETLQPLPKQSAREQVTD
jgi:hypothetical protein